MSPACRSSRLNDVMMQQLLLEWDEAYCVTMYEQITAQLSHFKLTPQHAKGGPTLMLAAAAE